jgi:hypothetical protein
MQLSDVIQDFSDLMLSIRMLFPHTDPKLVIDMMVHKLLYEDHDPKVSLEIFYKHGVDVKAKASNLYAMTGYVPSVYASEHRLVVEPMLTLEKLVSIASDDDIESVGGAVLCCINALLSKRKLLHA